MKSKFLFFITALTLLCLPKLNLGQAPNLRIASNFALFTAVGAFNNTGETTVSGDVGTHVGAFNAFPPGTMVGQIHVADEVSAQAAIDLNSAYSYLSSITCDSVIGTTLGFNQVLTPKVYCLGAASVLNGKLILDGQGNPNSLFIFKINGAFSSSTASNVVLINSALMDNVYWQINGAVDLGDSSVFKGTIIANGAMSLLEKASLLGRALSIAGAINLHTNTVDIGTGVGLPIELLNFNAECVNGNANIKWATASETNNNFFTIESSSDAVHWIIINKMKGAGNSSSLVNYHYTYLNLTTGICYYRLKQTDFDGRSNYSEIIEAKNCNLYTTSMDIAIHPNPSNGIFNYSTYRAQEQIRSIEFYNLAGKQIYYSEDNHSTIDLSSMQDGIYFGRFNSKKNSITKKIIIKK